MKTNLYIVSFPTYHSQNLDALYIKFVFWFCESINKRRLLLSDLVTCLLDQKALPPRLSWPPCNLLVNYDEHVLVNNFKFGVIY